MLTGPPAPPVTPPTTAFVCPFPRTHYGCVPTRPRPHAPHPRPKPRVTIVATPTLIDPVCYVRIEGHVLQHPCSSTPARVR